MKTTYAVLGLVIVLALGAGAYYLMQPTGPAQESQNETPDPSGARGIRPAPGDYTVDAEQSSIVWTAGKPLIAGYVHHGTLDLSGGTIAVGDATASGSFTIDMTSVKVTSLGGGKAGKESALEAHLKKDDFFGVDKFPTATFAIKSITPIEGENRYDVEGDLTLKGITRPVSFPATIYGEGTDTLRANAEFEINRTQWGITFNSSSFFDDLADSAIGDTVGLELMLVAKQ